MIELYKECVGLYKVYRDYLRGIPGHGLVDAIACALDVVLKGFGLGPSGFMVSGLSIARLP